MSFRFDKVERTPEFFRIHYDKVIILLIGLICSILILVIIVMYQVRHRPLPMYSAVMPNGQSISLIPVSIPILLPDTVITWASKAAVAAYTFDFVNYKKQINDARPYFTSSGFADYQNSINGLIATIAQNQLFVNGVVAGPPVITNQGDMTGNQADLMNLGYGWRIQIPFLVTYQSSEQTKKTHYTMVITIVRIPTQENPKGIGISQLIMG